MSVDRVLAHTLRISHRLAGAFRQRDEEGNGGRGHAHDDDTPLGTLRSLLTQPPGPADGVCQAYKCAAGPHAVELHQQVYRDHKSGREVPVSVLYPLGIAPAGGFPVVVVSPGLGARGQATRYLEQHLASHGYVVLSPVHSGSDWLAIFRRTPLAAFSRRELATRVEEVKLALDLLSEGRLPARICQRANAERAALVGHSFGALTIQAVAGLPVLDSEGAVMPLQDPRFQAFVCMSPYGDAFPARRLGMTQEGYARIDRPILFMSGDRDDLWTVGRGPNVHLRPYRWVTSAERFHVLVGDTRHSDFSQVLGRVKKHTAAMVNSTTTAFLDAYLQDDTVARSYLRHDLPEAASLYRSWAFVGGSLEPPPQIGSSPALS